MDWLNFLSGMGAASGQMSGQGANASSNPWAAAFGGGQPQTMGLAPAQQAAPQQIPNAVPGQTEAVLMGQQQMGQLQQVPEFGTEGTPQSLQTTLGQNNAQIDQMVANTPQAEFGQFTNPGVLPPMGAIPDQQPIQPVQQSFQAGGGQQMPQAQPFQGGQPQAQAGFGDLFNMTGSAPSSPGNENGFNPNMFLRMSEGYNRGGLLGALGMLLTDYK